MERKLYGMKELRAVSGMSRSQITKLEQEGFIEPVEVNAQNGYRYYDATSETRLRQYRMLRELGMSKKEISGYFTGEIDIDEFLEGVDIKISLLTRLREELSIREDNTGHRRFSYMPLPEVKCLVKRLLANSPGDVEREGWMMAEYMMENGIVPTATEPVFSVREKTESITKENYDEPYYVTLCVPISKDYENIDYEIKTYKKEYALTMLSYSEYRDIASDFECLWNEVRRRGLKPIGDARGIGIVAPYVNATIPRLKNVFRLAIPIEKPKDTNEGI